MRYVFYGALMAILTVALMPGAVQADSGTDVVNGMGTKLYRGITNTAFGWTSYGGEFRDHGARGVISGTAETLTRTTVGVAELGTFLFPNPHGYEGSQRDLLGPDLNYKPYMKPVHPWE